MKSITRRTVVSYENKRIETSAVHVLYLFFGPFITIRTIIALFIPTKKDLEDT